MKKVLITIFLFIAFLIIYFLQANFFPSFTIAGIMPNLFVVLVLFIGLYANEFLGVGFGLVIGIFLDSVYGNRLGPSAIMLCIVGFLGSYFDKNFSKENKLTILLMVIGVTSIYELGLYFLKSFLLDFSFETFEFLRILVFELIYNSLLTLIFYPLIQKSGYAIDRNFKQNNLLTRYF